MAQRNSEARAEMLAERTRLRGMRTGYPQYMPARTNLSTRGERGRPWLTKKHTPARKDAMNEHAHAALSKAEA